MSSIVNHKSLRSFQILQISIKSFVLIASSFSLDYAYKFVPIFKIDTSKKSLTLHSHMTRNIADPAVHTHSTTGEYEKAEIQCGISNARKEWKLYPTKESNKLHTQASLDKTPGKPSSSCN